MNAFPSVEFDVTTASEAGALIYWQRKEEQSLEGYLSEDEIEKLKEEFKKEALPHIGLLYNYAYKMTGNSDDADDLLQETYLRAYRFFHKFEKGTNCKAWLFRIMKNLFINNYRKNQKTPGQVEREAC